MKMHGSRFGIALVPAIMLFAFGCATLQPVQPEIRGVRPHITRIDFTGITMTFDLDVYNPNFFPIVAPRMKYAFSVGGARLFGAETTSAINLPQKQVGMLTFPVHISYFDLVRTYEALAYASEAAYSLDGGLLFPAGGRTLELPFSYRGMFPILRPPKFSDVNVDVAEVSPLRTKININALANNPNIFPLGIENLKYTLKFGDVQIADLFAVSQETVGAGKTAPLSFSAEVSTASAVLDVIRGNRIGQAQLLPSGSIQTPYGPVPLR